VWGARGCGVLCGGRGSARRPNLASTRCPPSPHPSHSFGHAQAPLNSTVSGKLLPVIFWLYGGSFEEGYDDGPFGIYDMAAHPNSSWTNLGVVVVVPNYRLGAYGFTTLTDTVTGEQVMGNAGFQDQQLALNWTFANIAHFGGNPQDITIAGESAGAMSVGLHLLAPGSRGKFRAAIMESNPSTYWYKDIPEAADFGSTVCSAAGCGTGLLNTTCDTTCLRGVDVSTLSAAWDTAQGDVIDYIAADWDHLLSAILAFTPVIDGSVIPQRPQEAWAAGNYAPVPILVGVNSNEGPTFVYGAVDFELPGFLYELALDALFGGDNANKILAVPDYQITNQSDARMPLGNVLTDYYFKCSSRQWLLNTNSSGWSYRYNHVPSVMPLLVKNFGLPAVCIDLVCHMAELLATFGLDSVPEFNASATPAELTLSAALQSYWTSFAINQDPSVARLPGTVVWTPYSQGRQSIVFQAPTEFTFEDEDSVCDLWDQIGYN
jgi:carboxylesterase type B